MKERPILFSAPMVHALLDGSKTQTRRVVKPRDLEWMDVHQGLRELCNAERCPYGRLGDRLYVREAWRTVAEANTLPPRNLTPAHRIWYEADDSLSALRGLSGEGKLRPSMFMPRWASRITLEITEVRVEQLQDISEADAIAEGIDTTSMFPWRPDEVSSSSADVSRYALLWESINGVGSWAANPWVWAVSFQLANNSTNRSTNGQHI